MTECRIWKERETRDKKQEGNSGNRGRLEVGSWEKEEKWVGSQKLEVRRRKGEGARKKRAKGGGDGPLYPIFPYFPYIPWETGRFVLV